MLITSKIIAKKYALAFLRASSQELSEDLLKRIAHFGDFLETQKSITAHLSLPTLSGITKTNIIEKITTHFSLNVPFKKMLFLLMDQKRVHLLKLIIQNIIQQYQKSQAIGVFCVSSSHSLQEQEKQ